MTPIFIATAPFDPSTGDTWAQYMQWAKIPQLTEVVGLDCLLCGRILDALNDEDWKHVIPEGYGFGYFADLDYLLARVADVPRKNILGLYRNPTEHIDTAPGGERRFAFLGYDLIEDATLISALTNCGGFPESFSNGELNQYGLLPAFARASQVKDSLRRHYPLEPHADCELYAIWRLQSPDHEFGNGS